MFSNDSLVCCFCQKKHFLSFRRVLSHTDPDFRHYHHTTRRTVRTFYCRVSCINLDVELSVNLPIEKMPTNHVVKLLSHSWNALSLWPIHPRQVMPNILASAHTHSQSLLLTPEFVNVVVFTFCRWCHTSKRVNEIDPANDDDDESIQLHLSRLFSLGLIVELFLIFEHHVNVLDAQVCAVYSNETHFHIIQPKESQAMCQIKSRIIWLRVLYHIPVTFLSLLLWTLPWTEQTEEMTFRACRYNYSIKWLNYEWPRRNNSKYETTVPLLQCK